MKKTIPFLFALFLITGCSTKASNKPSVIGEPVAPADTVVAEVKTVDEAAETSSDAVIQTAIREFLLGKTEAVRFTEKAKNDLEESTWPEVQCSVEGTLDAPESFKDLVVRKVGPNRYKYECVCPDHGDRYIDCCTVSANIASDGVVEIAAVTWDEP